MLARAEQITDGPFAGMPRGQARVIAADPAWRFKSNSEAKPGRNPMRHYRCMSLADIAGLPVVDLAAPQSSLWLWIPGPLLAIGAHLPIMRAWGFKPSGMAFVWIKLNPRAASLFFLSSDLAMGGGFTTRKNAEFVVLGKRGASVRRSAAVHEVIIAPRREHSRKPDEFYRRLEQYAAGPYVELFARQQRPGWDSWGNEVDKFEGEA